MRFLVITRPRPTKLPPDAIVAMLTAARDWLKEQQAKGEIEVLYGFPEGGGVAIVNTPSHEALNAAVQQYPLYPMTDWSIFPLCDVEQAIELGIKLTNERAAMSGARAA